MTKQTTLIGDAQTRLVNQRKTDEYDVDIGRANGGESHVLNTDVGDGGWLGNPYKTSDGHSREEALEKYQEAFHDRLEDDEFRDAVEGLRDKTLACWCTPKACHGDVILQHLQS